VLAEVVFTTPMGRKQEISSLESLRDLVFRGGDDFWAAGNGQAAIEVKGEEGWSRLLLMGLDAAGFFLVHESKTDSLCSINLSATADAAHKVYVGGEPIDVPIKNFLDKTLAWQVIADFVRDGKPSAQAEWEEWL